MTPTTQQLQQGGIVLLSNREPYEHVRSASGIEVRSPAGGLVSALDPILRSVEGTWIAWGSGSADREVTGESDRLQVPPDDPRYTLRRVWLDEQEIDGFYRGFANSALWPVCHMFIQHLEVRTDSWNRYREVNACFARAAIEEAERLTELRGGPGCPMVWVQDYHFALAPLLIRRKLPAALIHHFWHIPFPPPDVFRLIPVGVHEDLLRGLLGNDLVEFQTEGHARNFLDCIERLLPRSQVDFDAGTVNRDGRTVRVGVFPISIDVAEWEELVNRRSTIQRARELRESHAPPDGKLIVSVDRVDYTKGIVRRLHALEHIWTENRARRGQFTALFVATPSRTDVAAYAELSRELVECVSSINERFATAEWTPIVLINDAADSELLAAVYRAADVCLVSSLQDGMNLVAKEFIACQADGNGVLVLSRFTGAADELDGALLVNPFFIDTFAASICAALDMGVDERHARMQRMRERLSRATVHDWVDGVLEAARVARAQNIRADER